MKPIIPFALLSAFAAVSAHGAVTTPVGYVTEDLESGFNLVGLSLHEPTVVAGTLTGVASGSVSDSSADFTTSLTSGTTYILEITSGGGNGIIQVVDTFDATSLTTPQDLSDLGPMTVASGDSYRVREAATINSVFGADNESGLQEGSTAAEADVIYVPNDSGGYNQYYRNEGLPGVIPPSWQNLSGEASGDAPLVYTDGIFVLRRGAATSITLSGEVKTTDTNLVLANGFNLVSPGFPVGLTLDNSGMASSLQAGSTAAEADVVFVPNDSGGYAQYYYNEGLPGVIDPSWQGLDGSAAGDTELSRGFFIQRRGAMANAGVSVPYSTN